MFTRSLAAAGLVLSITLTAAPAAFAGQDPVYTGRFDNLAVQGYDPVAYFTEGKPVKGDKAFTTQYNGANFRFASQNNLDAFLADPEKYAPQYGGYCAWAMADGKFAKGDADYWAIVDGKLYLNYNANIQKKWNADRAGFISSANGHWPDVLTK